MKTQFNETFVYQAVQSGELTINPNDGTVWRVAARRGRKAGGTCLVPCKPRRAEMDNGNYLQVRVMVNGKRVYALAHRLVYLHCKGQLTEAQAVNHKNGNKRDNRPENLELASHSENILHAIHTLKSHPAANQSGEKNHNSKLTDAQVARIRMARKTGESLNKIAADFGIAFQTVSKIARGTSHKSLG